VASPLIASTFALAGGANKVEYPAKTLYENEVKSTGSLPIKITGTNFVSGATVEIGQGSGVGPTAIPASDVVVVSPTEITATTGGPAKAGTFNLFVIDSGGTSLPNTGDDFTYSLRETPIGREIQVSSRRSISDAVDPARELDQRPLVAKPIQVLPPSTPLDQLRCRGNAPHVACDVEDLISQHV
jgi:hypothetical protein